MSVVLLNCSVVAQAAAPKALLLKRAGQNGWVGFNIVSGRLVIVRSRASEYETTSRGVCTERMSVKTIGGKSLIKYELSSANEFFALDFRGGEYVHIQRLPKDKSSIVPMEFYQQPNGSIEFVVGAGPDKRAYKPKTIWHLFFCERDLCEKHLIPILKLIRPNWSPYSTLSKVEKELLHWTEHGDPCQDRWADLVKQLGDDRFSKRKAADRELRAIGRVLLPYLEQLDSTKPDPFKIASHRLSAEQKFRIKRIKWALSGSVEDDTVKHIAAWLSDDPNVWLEMFDRPEESTRRLAVDCLKKLLGTNIDFDPTADPSVRESQIERLRKQYSGN